MEKSCKNLKIDSLLTAPSMSDTENIEERNRRVEADKAWETSWTRRAIIAIFTWAFLGLYMSVIGVPDPWLNALIPTTGFVLSTLTLPFFKRWWLRSIYKK